MAKTRRTGQGTVYQRKDGRWEGAITHGYSEKGNPKRYRVIKGTRADAVAALNEIITKLNLGVPIGETKQSMKDFLQFWMDTQVKTSRAPKTVRFYEQMIRLYIVPAIGHMPLSKVTAQHVQGLLNAKAKDLSAQTILSIRATLRAAFNVAIRWNLLRENPAARTVIAKVERQDPVFLTTEEAKALLEKSSGHYTSRLLEFALLTGVRIGEATGVTWEDVDFQRETVHVRFQLQRVEKKLILRGLKSQSSRRVLALSPRAVECLKAQRADQLLWKADRAAEPDHGMNLCFTDTEGKPLDPKTVDKHLRRFAAEAEIKKTVSFHKLRHTVATHLASSGVPLSVVKDQLGHSQISLTVNTYSHAVPTVLKEAASKLDSFLSDI